MAHKHPWAPVCPQFLMSRILFIVFSPFLGFHIYIRKKIGILHPKTDIFFNFSENIFLFIYIIPYFRKMSTLFSPPRKFCRVAQIGDVKFMQNNERSRRAECVRQGLKICSENFILPLTNRVKNDIIQLIRKGGTENGKQIYKSPLSAYDTRRRLQPRAMAAR